MGRWPCGGGGGGGGEKKMGGGGGSDAQYLLRMCKMK